MFRASDHFRSSRAPNPKYKSPKIREWVCSPPEVRLDILQTDPKVNALLCFNAGLFTTIDGARVIRAASTSPKKVVVGAVGKPSSFQVFSVEAPFATSNFYAFTELAEDKSSPAGLPVGPSINRMIVELPRGRSIKDLFRGDPGGHDIAITYLLLAILGLTSNTFDSAYCTSRAQATRH